MSEDVPTAARYSPNTIHAQSPGNQNPFVVASPVLASELRIPVRDAFRVQLYYRNGIVADGTTTVIRIVHLDADGMPLGDDPLLANATFDVAQNSTATYALNPVTQYAPPDPLHLLDQARYPANWTTFLVDARAASQAPVSDGVLTVPPGTRLRLEIFFDTDMRLGAPPELAEPVAEASDLLLDGVRREAPAKDAFSQVHPALGEFVGGMWDSWWRSMGDAFFGMGQALRAQQPPPPPVTTFQYGREDAPSRLEIQLAR